jgi:hypothetical protein
VGIKIRCIADLVFISVSDFRRACALLQLFSGYEDFSSVNTPAFDGLEVHRTIQLDPNLKLSQTTSEVFPRRALKSESLHGAMSRIKEFGLRYLSQPIMTDCRRQFHWRIPLLFVQTLQFR